MKNILAVSACLFLLLGSRAAYAANSAFSLSAGYRSDKLDWNIAGDTTGHNPNVLSELKWESLRIFEFKAGLRTDLNKRQYLVGSFGFGWINDGTNQDSDYRGDNRTLEYSRSNNDADMGNVWDLSLGIGLNNNMGPNLSVNPVAGVSFHRQNLRIRNGFQTVATSGTPPVGPFADLNSKYDANWYGPWAGIDVKYAAESLVYTGGLELHLARYLAEADWNLRSDLDHPKSFEHTALGGGVLASAGVRYAVTERLSLTGNAAYQRWTTTHGRDRTFFKNGTTADTRLNEVNWISYGLSLGAGYSF